VALVHHLFSGEFHTKWLNRVYGQIEKYYLQSVDGFIFNSQATGQSVRRLSGCHKPCVIATPGGDRLKRCLSISRIEDRSHHPGLMRLLYLGLVIKRKGLLPLIHTLRRLPFSQWQLDVVGSLSQEPAYVDQVQKAIEACRLSAHIHLWGCVGDHEAAEKMARAHVLCMPYAYEGFGIATLEALGMGVPVLGSNAGATPEIIQQGINGLLFDSSNESGVCQAIASLHKNRTRLARMSVAAYKSSARFPTWRQSMQRIEHFLMHMVRRSYGAAV
jgi:glycosyltransferase involved in cell wall biosynthesis